MVNSSHGKLFKGSLQRQKLPCGRATGWENNLENMKNVGLLGGTKEKCDKDMKRGDMSVWKGMDGDVGIVKNVEEC